MILLWHFDGERSKKLMSKKNGQISVFGCWFCHFLSPIYAIATPIERAHFGVELIAIR